MSGAFIDISSKLKIVIVGTVRQSRLRPAYARMVLAEWYRLEDTSIGCPNFTFVREV